MVCMCARVCVRECVDCGVYARVVRVYSVHDLCVVFAWCIFSGCFQCTLCKCVVGVHVGRGMHMWVCTM